MNNRFTRKSATKTFYALPLVVRTGKKTQITVYGKGELKDGKEYELRVVPMLNSSYSLVSPYSPLPYDVFTLTAKDESLTFSYVFSKEQEYSFSVAPAGTPRNDVGWETASVYAVEEDLYRLVPLVGDMHSHSNRSDGRDDPLAVASAYRKNGYDFMSLTDHNRFAPSAELSSTLSALPFDFRVYHGEEIHLEAGYLHCVGFGETEGVNEYYFSHHKACEEEIHRLSEQLAPTLPSDIHPLEYAYRLWVSREIRKRGGLCIHAHPFWLITQTVQNPALEGDPLPDERLPGAKRRISGFLEYHCHENMMDFCVKEGIYDAMEMLSGQSVHENNMQWGYYESLKEKGLFIPAVGSSDSHGVEGRPCFFGFVRSMVFAEDNSLDSIKNAILHNRTVVIEQMPDEAYRVYGPYRLLKFARFLLPNYTPGHDALCREEGDALRAYTDKTGLTKPSFDGDGNPLTPEMSAEAALSLLQKTKGQTERYYLTQYGK
ncbi:MAG: hypothetical protein MJ078_05620 [Clostridia bacterium]|nr:hypothetical protein [Clostridia bacterium]